MASTIKDIQRLTGLSLSTISKYLNGGNVLESNRLAIQQAVLQLDFRVNPHARGLKTNRTRTIGALVPDLIGSFQATVLTDIEYILRQHGYALIVCNSHMDHDTENEAISFLLDKQVDGLLTIPSSSNASHLLPVIRRAIPVIQIDRLAEDTETDSVLIDNVAAARLGAAELLRFGHRRIGMICGTLDMYTMRRRHEGFMAALAEAGSPANPAWMHLDTVSFDSGYLGMKRIWQQSERPTAVFCASYEMTLGAIMAINEMGIRIPEDLSLVGFDNLTLSRIHKPALTLVVQPMKAIAESAAGLLLCRLNQLAPEPARTICLEAELHRGASVGPA